MSLLYYSRMRFVTRLLPLTLASSLATGAHIVSVFGPGRDDRIFQKTSRCVIRIITTL